MNIGSLEIQLLADISKLKADMSEAKGTVSDAMDSMSTAVGRATTALGALGIVASLGGIKDMMLATVSAAAEMYKLSESTGVAVESLSGMRSAAKLSGTSIDEVGAGLIKLSKSMVEAQDGTGKAAETFRALGVNIKDTNGNLKTSDQVMLEVAKSLQGFATDASSTTAVLNLMGKSSAELIPFLNELAEKGDLAGKVTTEQAKAADDLEKALIQLKSQTDGYVRAVALELLPVLLRATDLFWPLVQVSLALVGVFYGVPALMGAGAVAITLLAGTMVEATAATSLFGATVATIGPTFAAMAATFGVAQTVIMSGLGVMVAAFAGWQIGEWLYDNFLQARLGAIAFVDGTMTAWEHLKYAASMLWLAFTDLAMGAYEKVGTGLAYVLDKVGAGLKLIGLASTGEAILGFSESIRSVTKNTIDFEKESAILGQQLKDNTDTVHSITGAMADEAIARFKSTTKTTEQKESVKLSSDAMRESKNVMDGLNASIQEHVNKMQAEMDAGEKLTAVQQLQAKIMADIDTGKVKLTLTQKLEIDSTLQLALAIEKTYLQYTAAKKAIDDTTKALDEHTAKMNAEIETGGKLTTAQTVEYKLMQDITSGKVVLTDAQKLEITTRINLAKAIEDTYAAYLAEKKALAEGMKANADYLDQLQKGTSTIQDASARQSEHNQTLFLNRQELAVLSIAKDLDRAATLERNAAIIDAGGPETAATEEMRKQATALRDLAELKAQGIHVQAAKDAAVEWAKTTQSIATGLSSALVDAVTNGKSIWLTFRNYLVSTIIDGAIKNALSGVIQSGLNELISGITGLRIGNSGGSLVGNVAGSVVSNATGGASVLSTAGSVLGVNAGGFTGGGLTGAIGIGATAGSGVVASGVGTGAAGIVGTDLGLLGAAGTAGAAGTGAAAVGAAEITGAAALEATLAAIPGWGWAALAAIAVASALSGGKKAAESTGDAEFTYGPDGSKVSSKDWSGIPYAKQTAAADGQVQTLEWLYQEAAQALGISTVAATFRYSGNMSEDGEKFAMGGQAGGGYFYQPETPTSAEALELASKRSVFAALRGSTLPGQMGGLFWSKDPGSMSSAEIDKALADARALPRFAMGGDFMGGLRIVGENGPELEATGPSRIFNADQTASMLRSGGASNDELLAELRLCRIAFEQAATNTNRTNKTLDRIAPGGDAMQVRAIV